MLFVSMFFIHPFEICFISFVGDGCHDRHELVLGGIETLTFVLLFLMAVVATSLIVQVWVQLNQGFGTSI